MEMDASWTTMVRLLFLGSHLIIILVIVLLWTLCVLSLMSVFRPNSTAIFGRCECCAHSIHLKSSQFSLWRTIDTADNKPCAHKIDRHVQRVEIKQACSTTFAMHKCRNTHISSNVRGWYNLYLHCVHKMPPSGSLWACWTCVREHSINRGNSRTLHNCWCPSYLSANICNFSINIKAFPFVIQYSARSIIHMHRKHILSRCWLLYVIFGSLLLSIRIDFNVHDDCDDNSILPSLSPLSLMAIKFVLSCPLWSLFRLASIVNNAPKCHHISSPSETA